MTATQTAETTIRVRAAAKKPATKSAAPKKAAKPKKAAPAVDMMGIYTNKATGKFEVTIFWGGYKTAAEAAAARAHALQCKAAYKERAAD